MLNQVGVIGGGQLAQMLGMAAKSLGIEMYVQTADAADPAVPVAAGAILAPLNDPDAILQLATGGRVLTFENEFVDLEVLRPLEEEGIIFRPSLESLAVILDKYEQRRYLQSLELPVPQFIALDPHPDPMSLADMKFPLVLKTRRHGYDGRGTWILQSQADWEQVLQEVGDQPLLLEEWIPFEQELAVIAARSVNGDMVIYPVAETQQEDQVCRRVFVPAAIPPATAQVIQSMLRVLMQNLQWVGTLAVELFLTPSGEILINELAPRTHNSAHYTLDASHTSQFEQHLRAVCQMPLRSGELISGGAVMVNLLGYEQSDSDYMEQRERLAKIPHAHVYWYGKVQARPGRKLGHVTVSLKHKPQATQARRHAIEIADQIESIWYGR